MLVAYAIAALVAGAVPLMTVGVFPDFGGDPLATQRRMSAMVEFMDYAQLAAWGTGVTAMLLHRVDQLQEASRDDVVAADVFA